ncbi:MAG: TonB-dependent receptor [Treponema sp.]|nr:TonB-dependent receptor [Treponema sp.]
MKFLLLFLLLPFLLFAQDITDDEYFFFYEDEGIMVTGTVQRSQHIQVVEKEQIENSSAGDLVNLLHETLGLNIVRYGAYGNQAGINLRGFDSKRIAFLIDGTPVNSSLDGKFEISQININSIERIEVIYGGSDSKYNVSGAFGGIVNIITVKKQEQGLKLTASVLNTSYISDTYRDRNGETQNPQWEDLFDTQNYSVSAAYGREAFSLTANIFFNRAENHFIFTDHYNYSRRKDNNEVKNTGASVSFVWELPDYTKLITSSNFFFGDSNFPVSGFSGNIGSQKDFSARQNFMLDAPRVFHDDLATEASFTWHFSRRDYTSPADVFSRHDQHSLAVINRWNWYPLKQLALGSGIDYRFIIIDSTEIGSRNRHDGGVYLTAEFKPVKQLLLIPSIKAVFSGANQMAEGAANAAIIPKFGLLWEVTEQLAVRNNYFRSFKFPDFEELYWNGGGGSGNPDLKPEDGWGADLGAEWHITENMYLESVFFTQWIKDSIHWFSGSGNIWRPENVGEAVFFGLENRFLSEIPLSKGPFNKITMSLTYQYILSYLLSYGYTFSSNKRIPYSPEHTINGSAEIAWNSGSFTVSGHYESLRYHNTANLTSLKPYFLLNAGVKQDFGEDFSFFGDLRNILNTSYESFNDYPMPGISLSLGLKANFNTYRKGE